jgi:hypothetical protein
VLVPRTPVETGNPLWATFIRGAGNDLAAEYRERGTYRDGRELLLPSVHKLQTVLAVRKAARERGMTFGAADNELQFLSDTACCCSGVDRFAGFERWFGFQIGHAVRRCRGGAITYPSIADEWHPQGSVNRYLNSRSRMTTTSKLSGSIEDHIKARWDDPQRTAGPGSFYGVVSTGRRDPSGRLIYSWTDEMAGLLTTLGPPHMSASHPNASEMGLGTIRIDEQPEPRR